MNLEKYQSLFETAGQQHGVDPKLLRAIVEVESAGNPRAVSNQGAQGLTQLMPATAKSLGVTDAFDPAQAIPAAAKLLAENHARYQDADKAVLAYHGGTDERNWGPKTKNYLQKVAQAYGRADMPQDISDDDLLAALTGEKPKAKADLPKGQLTDEQLLAALTKGADKGNKKVVDPQKKDGYWDGVKKRGTGAVANFLSIPTFGLSDELLAASAATGGVGRQLLDTAMGKNNPVNWGANYDKSLNYIREGQQAYNENEMLGGLGAQAGGLIAAAPVNMVAQPTMAVGNALARVTGSPLTGAMVGGAMTGAVGGGLYGFGAGEGGLENRLESAKDNAAIGGAIGVATPLVFKAGELTGQGLRNLASPFIKSDTPQIAKGVIENFAGGPVTIANANKLVPGSEPTLAEATGNPGVAALQRTLRNSNPNSPFVAREAEQAAARNSLFDIASGSPADIVNATKARDAAAKVALDKIFAKNPPTDTQPIVSKIDSLLKGSSGRRPAVKRALNEVRDMLFNSKGQTAADARTVYDSVRKGINDLIEGKDLTKAYGKAAASQLIEVRDKLDAVLEKVTPGFKSYLSDFTASSMPIDAMDALQKLKITDSKGNITLSKVQSAIRTLEDARKAAGVKSAKAIADAQMEALKAIRDDLLRGTNNAAGMPLNSATVQNALNEAAYQKLLPESIGAFGGKIKPEVVGGTVGGTLGGLIGAAGGPGAAAGSAGLGSAIGTGLGNIYSHAAGQKNALVRAQIENMLLNPQVFNAAAATQLANKPGLLARGAKGIPTTVAIGNRLLAPAQ